MLAEKIITNYEEKINALTSALNNSQNRCELFEKRCEQYAQAYDSLLAQIKELQRYRFGKRSERFIDPEHPQLNLLDDTQNKFAAADAAGEIVDNDVQVVAHIRKKKNKAEKNIPVRIKIVPVPEDNKLCACCGKEKKLFDTKQNN